MIVQSVREAPPRARVTDNPRRPKCPRCGGPMIVAERSRFNADGSIDNAWSCDRCGHEFVTSVSFQPR